MGRSASLRRRLGKRCCESSQSHRSSRTSVRLRSGALSVSPIFAHRAGIGEYTVPLQPLQLFTCNGEISTPRSAHKHLDRSLRYQRWRLGNYGSRAAHQLTGARRQWHRPAAACLGSAGSAPIGLYAVPPRAPQHRQAIPNPNSAIRKPPLALRSPLRYSYNDRTGLRQRSRVYPSSVTKTLNLRSASWSLKLRCRRSKMRSLAYDCRCSEAPC